MTTTPKPAQQPAETTIADLTAGQHIWHDGAIREIRHVEPYTHNGKPRHLAILDGGRLLDKPAGDPVAVATDDDIAEARAAGRRTALANALHDLANSIVAEALPLPSYSLDVNGYVGTRAELQRWAEHLGVDIRPGGVKRDIPVAKRGLTAGDLTLNVHFQSPPEPVETSEPAAGSGQPAVKGAAPVVDAAPARAAESADSAGPGPLRHRSLIREVRERGMWPGQVHIGADPDYGQAGRA